MTMGREYRIEAQLQSYLSTYGSTPPDGYWMTKCGDILEISEMDLDHVFNCGRMLCRKGGVYSKSFKELIAEVDNRGEKHNMIAFIKETIL